MRSKTNSKYLTAWENQKKNVIIMILLDAGNGLVLNRCQATAWTNVDLLSIGWNCTKISNSNFFFQENVFENVVCKWQPLCNRLNVLI